MVYNFNNEMVLLSETYCQSVLFVIYAVGCSVKENDKSLWIMIMFSIVLYSRYIIHLFSGMMFCLYYGSSDFEQTISGVNKWCNYHDEILLTSHLK